MAKGKKNTPRSTPIEAIRHQDKRLNIPTEELRDFVAEDEQAPKTLLYPRDPSLDPQLVWKGKDEQDQQDLAVPVVPVYIQEKIQPQAIIEDLRASLRNSPPRLRGGAGGGVGEDPQLSLFSDFNGLPEAFDERVDFYNHEGNWQNRMILGDSLLVMSSLAEKEGLKGKVQTIYIDPPYGIKFGSNWQVSTRKRDVRDGKAEDLTRQPEQIRAFRDTWKLGIHSYLSYLRDRLVVARELLTDTGSVFVQIGDENVHLVRCVMDEVFGSENFISQISFSKTSSATTVFMPGTVDFILWYVKNPNAAKYRPLFIEKELGGEGSSKYDQVELPDLSRRAITPDDRLENGAISNARPFRLDNLTSQSMGREKGIGAASWFKVEFQGSEYFPNIRNRWKTNEAGMTRLISARRIESSRNSLSYVRFIGDFPAFPLANIWTDIGGIQSRADPKVYVVQTATKAVERCLLMTTDPGDLVLDPTCGSGTTAYVAEQWGRRWITIDTSRVALALARTRLMSARYPYYLLADEQKGIAKEQELTGQRPPPFTPKRDIKKGFVYRRVPHVTLKSIANNEEIDGIHARWHARLEPLRAEINRLLKQQWEEWELPREPEEKWPAAAKEKLAEWWSLRRARQKEIDASIARHADTETLYDQPYEDSKRVRVSGPFTVESLAPHRVLAIDEERPVSEVLARRDSAAGQFETMILDNLRKAGVQNTVKNERLRFDRLEPYAGLWIHGAGEYTDSEGKVRRVAISIGPEHGTVGPQQVKEAAKEAVQGVGYDVLVVCGFAFDPHVPEEAKRYGKLQVLVTRMNPDLAMGDELLKKTGAGNLFMVFGEPDLDVRKLKDGRIEVELKGVDVYDPTTGQIRSSSTDDIACWFIDTDYNGESFFVRHAYFTGGDEPYDRLKRALRAEIDEAAWASLYRTTSRPFPAPSTGKIAVKVINHYGDEVLKVYEVSAEAKVV